MTRVHVRGFKLWVQRKRRADGSIWTSRMYCQHRATGRMIDLVEKPLGSAAWFAECERLDAELRQMDERKARPGTLGGLIAHFLGHEHFRNLAPRTQRDYRQLLDYLAPIADTPIHLVDTPLCSDIHDKAVEKLGWRRANYLRIALIQCFKFGVPKGLATSNPAEDVIPKPRPRSAAYANRPWSAAEEQAMLEAASPPLRLALALMGNTGLDPSDAIRIRRDALGSGVLFGLRGKTQVEVAVPVGRRLRAALDKAPRHEALTLLATSRGLPWSYSGLSSAFHRLKVGMERSGKVAPGLTMKGLRHTVATVLREAGCEERAIADLLGQKTTSMAGHYSRSANLARKNAATVEVLDSANDRRTESVKPSPKSVKPWRMAENGPRKS